MQPSAPKKILAVVQDLFFTVKINDSAKRAGLDVQFLKSERDALDKAAEGPVLIILDLNFAEVDHLKLIRELKFHEATKKINVLGYLSHIQVELKQQAQEAGCDTVLPKSAFSQNLLQILKRYAD